MRLALIPPAPLLTEHMDVSACDRVEAAAREQDDVGLVLRHGFRLDPVLVPVPVAAFWMPQRER